MTNLKKFAVTYEIDYTHRVVVGVAAPDAETAKQLASDAFDEGSIWDNTEEMLLLFDDYEEVDDETLLFSAEEVSEFPEPDSSVKAIKQKEFAFYACQSMLAGQLDSARDFAMKAMPNFSVALSSEQDNDDRHKESTWKVISENGCDPFEVIAAGREDALRDALHAIGWTVSSKQEDVQAIPLDDSLLPSTEVLGLAKDHDLKLSLSLAGGLRATHYLSSDHDGQYFHEGMDGVIHEIIPEDFLDTYPDSLGKIWHVDEKISTIPMLHDFIDIHSLVINSQKMTVAE